MILVGAVAEIEPEDVRFGLEECTDDFFGITGGSKRCDDLCLAMALHISPALAAASYYRVSMSTARKSLTFVSVGPGGAACGAAHYLNCTRNGI